jgi:hypothetical protein
MISQSKYIVLNDKLLPDKVALLLLKEGLGESFQYVEEKFNLSELQSGNPLKLLLDKAEVQNLIHNYTKKFINEMIVKMITTNKTKKADISVTIYSGDKTYLLIDF